jgi:hypothetical protein
MHRSDRYKHQKPKPKPKPESKPKPQEKPAPRRDSLFPGIAWEDDRGRRLDDEESHASRYRSHSRSHSRFSRTSNASAADPGIRYSLERGDHHELRPSSRVSDASSVGPPIGWDDDISSDGDEDDQDIDELWFPGAHADIGGGWPVPEGEAPMSHIPLVWIVREAQKSGLEFDEEKMQALDCLNGNAAEGNSMPTIEISTSTGNEKIEDGGENQSKFRSLLMGAASKGTLHDCLRFNQGTPAGTVLRWRLMEWLPFRRLDLTDDGKWKPIRWFVPLSSLMKL